MTKLHKLAISMALLCATGCYNLVVVNVGIGNKSAAAVAAPLDPVAECAALASMNVTVTPDPLKTSSAIQQQQCAQVLTAAQKGKKL